MNKHLKTFVWYLYYTACLFLHRKFGNIGFVIQLFLCVVNKAEIETTSSWVVVFVFYSTIRRELLDKFEKIYPNFLNLNAKDQRLFCYMSQE